MSSSVREYAALYLGKAGGGGNGAAGGGNVLLNAGSHALDGSEHTAASDQTRLDASTTAHGLLPKLSGDAGDFLDGTGAFRVVDASDVDIADAGGYFTGTDVEAALQELGARAVAAVPVDHGNMGSTETIDVSGGHDWHRGNLNVACAITVAGFTVDEGLVVVVELTGTGAITWDPDVDAAGDDQPDASGYTAFVLFTSAGDSAIKLVKVGGSSGSALTVKDEGSSLDTAVTSIDAVGAGVAATNTGHAVTLTIPGQTFATPAVVLGTAAAAGAASTGIRSDSTIVAFDATVPVTQAFSDAAATGSAAVAARRDHVHGMPATPATGGSGDHEHIIDVFNGDAATTAFELSEEPLDPEQVFAFVGGSWTALTMSGSMNTTATFGSAPGSGTGNVVIQYPAVAA